MRTDLTLVLDFFKCNGFFKSSIKYEVLVKGELNTFWFHVNRKEGVLYKRLGLNLYVST